MPETSHKIYSRAPIRICDNGGWTDTWFAEHGAVLNIAVTPDAKVSISLSKRTKRPPVRWVVENFGDCYDYDPSSPDWVRHPLLEAAVRLVGLPQDTAVEIHLSSQAPSGAATGTSAAVTVALVGSLLHLNGEAVEPEYAASLAHQVETRMLGRQSGIQDQLSAAYGGINWIEMDAYPHARVTPVHIAQSLAGNLEQCLSLIYLGKGHDSSGLHEAVISSLEHAGPDCPQLDSLRQTAQQAYHALLHADLPALGEAMCENTAAQQWLHPGLISEDARQMIETARSYQALGWKVNGAGGEGGSITILGPQDTARRDAMLQAMLLGRSNFKLLPIHLDWEGLRVWEAE